MGLAHSQVRRGFHHPLPHSDPVDPQLPKPHLRQQGCPSCYPLACELLLPRFQPFLSIAFGKVDDEMSVRIWQGMLTGLLGNMTLLSYFIKKKEAKAIVVQTLGVVLIYVVLGQLAMAKAMSLPYFTAISLLVVLGLLLIFMNYFRRLHEGVWQVWEDFITVVGISVLPQVRCFGS
ncbi:hypothetical protein Cni_G07061 [Canna indica]|uniref:Uncharacterized protein n=1 Tax=Canna indica TaxID=4628 RepID=A0AAQ3Q6K5_9LILI|nr:hypothetical protein Cni_G07061 [Canna indica]